MVGWLAQSGSEPFIIIMNVVLQRNKASCDEHFDHLLFQCFIHALSHLAIVQLRSNLYIAAVSAEPEGIFKKLTHTIN